MPCPRDPLGQSVCNIVQHPDRPSTESFCSTCGKRFYTHDSSAGSSFLPSLAAAIAVVLLILFVKSASTAPAPDTRARPASATELAPTLQ